MKPLCYPASEAIYHLMGGKEAGLTPMRIEHEGISHWYLRWETPWETFYIDPTAAQFSTPVPYEEGRGMGFQTKDPSARARALMEKELPPEPVVKWKYGCKHGLPNFVHCPECDS